MATTTRTTTDTWELGARAGYAVSGLLHVMIGVLALQLAFGDPNAEVDQSGALQTVASTPFGAAVLWFSVVAFAALAVWQAAAAAHVGHAGRASSYRTSRAKSLGKAGVYAALAVTAFSFARGGSSSSSQQTSGFTARLLEAPAGQLLVGLVGAVVIGVGVYHVVKGARKKFLEDLHGMPGGHAGRGTVVCGVVGYVGKGAALVVVGALLVWAGATADPSKATGLDGALHLLREQPAGPFLLALVALGFLAYGVYSVVRTRYGRL